MAKKKNNREDIEKNKKQSKVIGNELKKVSWPKADELARATAAVLFLIVVISLIILISDTVFSFGFNKIKQEAGKRQEKIIQEQEQKDKQVQEAAQKENTAKEQEQAQNQAQEQNTNN